MHRLASVHLYCMLSSQVSHVNDQFSRPPSNAPRYGACPISERKRKRLRSRKSRCSARNIDGSKRHAQYRYSRRETPRLERKRYRNHDSRGHVNAIARRYPKWVLNSTEGTGIAKGKGLTLPARLSSTIPVQRRLCSIHRLARFQVHVGDNGHVARG
jgi:hypothetical protein